MLEALIFDVDGTIAETEDLHRRAFNLAFEQHAVELAWDEREYRRMLRVTGGKERIAAALAELGVVRPAGEIAAIHEAKTRHYAALLGSVRHAWRPGVRRLMDEARAAGMRLALCTTTSAPNLDPLFAPTLGPGWRAGFDAIVTGEAAPRKKPWPDAYHEALRRLKIEAGQAVAFEDSAAGVAAARGAGIAVIATPSAWFPDDDVSAADLVLEHLGDGTQPWAEARPPLGGRMLRAAGLAAWHEQREAACSPRQ